MEQRKKARNIQENAGFGEADLSKIATYISHMHQLFVRGSSVANWKPLMCEFTE